MAENSPGQGMFLGASSIAEIIQIIKSAVMKRTQVEFGVRKEVGVSMERARKQANQAAIDLLNRLQPGKPLTDAERQTLAGYTGEGGIGGSEYEYYTPQHVAAGMWDMMKLYGADTGNTLEPSAGAGIFHETKPRGVMMTATEISAISGKINMLLHPEDSVSITPFEALASKTPDGQFDSVIGNVPFGDSRGAFANLDPDYKGVQNIGHYFVLRTLDKLKPGGISCLIVPYGMTSGSKHKKFREQVSRRAEFLGAHRLPSGTFEESGTATAVDIWVLQKHPDALADKILELPDNALERFNVLWPTFILGQWFEKDGRRFQHGEAEMQGSGKFQRLVIKNDQITNGQMRQYLAHKFGTRIDWQGLDTASAVVPRMINGEKRFINNQWYRMEEGRLVIDTSINATTLSVEKYGVTQYEDIRTLTSQPEGLLSLSFEQLMNIAADYPETIPVQYQRLMLFAGKQKSKMRERVLRGSIIGLAIQDLQDLIARGAMEGDAYTDMHADLQKLISVEFNKYGNPHAGARVDLSGEGGGAWLRFKASITEEGRLSELVRGELDRTTGSIFRKNDHADVVRHLFNEISLDPVTLADFRANYEGELPESDDELVALLAGVDGVAITPEGELMPFDRSTSGDVGLMNSGLMAALLHTDDERVKANYLNQLAAIKEKRKWTDVDNITFKLNSRWLDRRLVLEFLHDRGYDDLKYVADIVVEDGRLVSDLNYTGRDGVFAGYRYKTVMEKNKLTGETKPVYKRFTPKDPFDAQLENYLNGARASRGSSVRINDLEEDFNTWIRQHDEIDNLTQQYNDAFNAYIPFEHSGATLNLTSLSGEINPMDYQNSEVRRVSEDGRGIIGFGTGLGKTFTAYALEAFNFENGRTKRTAYVVPKSVLENWYHEAHQFYNAAALAGFLFVGLNEVRGEDGGIRQVPVLDQNGNQKLGKDGQPLMRNALTLASSAEIKERMNMIPQSNYRAVVLTKEQYAAIPLRVETIDEHAADVLYAQAEAGRVNLDGDKHSDAKKRNSIRAKASDTGTAKAQDFPYFEDMGFDSVIVDEGHNYRNSYSAGREAAALAYLPTGAQAKSARDMAIKNAYLMKKYNGRGPVMLTATPLVNSPIDAFNMLSHVVPMEEWIRMGIHTPDDFVKVFGKTELVRVQKLSGELEEKEGLVGFQNLDGLRGIFHRWTTLKTAKDVSAQVKIPEVKELNQKVPLTQYQQETYEYLRERAQALSDDPPVDENGDPKVMFDSRGNPIEQGQDAIFSIIRDMDRVCTDPDLYHRVITFNFPADKLLNVQALADDLPENVKSAGDDLEDEDASVSELNASGVEVVEGYARLVVPDTYEDEVMSRLAKYDLTLADVTHPIPPKYSMLIERLREGMANGGKQIIFSDEKSQHNKLKRIIASALPIAADQIGILNATTVAEAAKGAKKPKRVKRPAEPKEDATAEALAAYYEKKAIYDEYVASLSEISLGGLESIASDYQEGRTRILICNKKAEVGINLHMGTADMHHLTLPWTPASIDQRNGRGARVGGTQDSVNAHYYCGEGSFDEFRLATLKRKKNWITDILTSDKATMDNADANTMEEMQLLLAANPEERERKRQLQEEKIIAAARQKAANRAHIDMANYIKAKHAAKGDPDSLREQIGTHNTNIERKQANLQKQLDELEELEGDVAKYAQEVQESKEQGQSSWSVQLSEDRLRRANSRLRDQNTNISDLRQNIQKEQDAIRKKERVLTRIQKAASTIKKLRPQLERAQRDGLIGGDGTMLDHADEIYQNRTGKIFQKGRYYESDVPRGGYDSEYTDRAIVRITSLDVDAGTCEAMMVWVENSRNSLRKVTLNCETMLFETHYSESEIALKSWMYGGVALNEAVERLSVQDFRKYMREGELMLKSHYILYQDANGFGTEQVMNGNSWNSSGSFTYGAEDWFKRNADKVVYPDGNDETLKAQLAKAFREKSYLDLAKPFFQVIYGNDYQSQMQQYGEQASEVVIAETVAAVYNDRSAAANSDTYNEQGTGTEQIKEFTDYGKISATYHDVLQSRLLRDSGWIPGEYVNTKAFETAMVNYIATKRKETERLIVVNVKDQAQDKFRKFQQECIALGLEGVLDAVNSMPYITFSRNFLENGRDMEAYVDLYAYGVVLGLIDKAEVSATSFWDSQQRYAVSDRINTAFTEARARPADERWNEARLKAGLITQADIDAAKAKRVEIEAEEVEKKAAHVETGIIIKRNETTLLAGRYKNVHMLSGEYWCLQDPEGKGGALFRAKDELKAKYNAFFYNGKNPNDECPGAWWLIKIAVASADDIMAIIAKY